MGLVKISVCMATYNGERFVRQQLESILSQLSSSDEVIVVDDGSTDSTLSIIEALRDPRITVHRNERNLGVIATFDRAITLANGDIIFLSDQDDVWEPQKVNAVTQYFESHPQTTLVLSDASVIDDAGRIIQPSFFMARGGFSASLTSNLWKNKFLGCVMAFRAAMRSRVLPIPSETPMQDMWIGIVNRMHGEVAFLPQPLIRYRRHSHNLSPSQRAPWGRVLFWRWRFLRVMLKAKSRTR
jgi:cellulose synthase/poly-beta-1,6-N-acetylglucosamine synthase-like glycosyltransferase